MSSPKNKIKVIPDLNWGETSFPNVSTAAISPQAVTYHLGGDYKVLPLKTKFTKRGKVIDFPGGKAREPTEDELYERDRNFAMKMLDREFPGIPAEEVDEARQWLYEHSRGYRRAHVSHVHVSSEGFSHRRRAALWLISSGLMGVGMSLWLCLGDMPPSWASIALLTASVFSSVMFFMEKHKGDIE